MNTIFEKDQLRITALIFVSMVYYLINNQNIYNWYIGIPYILINALIMFCIIDLIKNINFYHENMHKLKNQNLNDLKFMSFTLVFNLIVISIMTLFTIIFLK